MGKVTPKEIAERIIASFDIESCKEIETCIEHEIRVLETHLSEAQVFDIADRIKERVRNYIDIYIKECDDKRLLPRARWSDSDPGRLIGRSFIFRNDPSEVVALKRRLKLMPEIWDFIQTITSDEFENFCCKFLLENGFINLEVTKRTRDGGIDFRGETKFGTHLLPISLRVVGQAKRYNKTYSVSEPEVRGLWGAVHNGISGVSQVQAVFLTTSQYTPDAMRFAKRNRILTIEGEQIAQFIAEFGIGVIADNEEDLYFSKEELIRWISDLDEG